MNIKEAYKVMLDSCEIKKGDVVKVLRAAENYEMGWPSTWNSNMTNSVGKELEVVRLSGTGITLGGGGYIYPFFVLEKISTLPKSIRLSDDYDVEFLKGGKIKVGCQEIPFSKVKEIYEAAKEANEL